MGTLVVDQVDLNDVNMVKNLKSAVGKLVNNSLSYYPLKFKPNYYFEVPSVSIPSDRGWYIILDDKTPIYVGKADDLNARLNTNNGSRDNFANQTRQSDSERNFIKKFVELSVFSKLRVCILREINFCSESGFNSNSLTDRDRGNIEKLINVFRGYFIYK